jgi:hypothetical protein
MVSQVDDVAVADAGTTLALRECFYALVGLHIATGKKSGTADWALNKAAKELARLGHPPQLKGTP